MDVLTIAGWIVAAASSSAALYCYLEKAKAENMAALAEARLSDAHEKTRAFEQLRAEMTEAAKASVLGAGADISSKLLADHKREALVAFRPQRPTAVDTKSSKRLNRTLRELCLRSGGSPCFLSAGRLVTKSQR